MSEIKQYSAENKSVRADTKDMLSENSDKNLFLKHTKRKQRKKLPVVVDIAIGVLLLAFAVGIIIGAYVMFRYYSDDFGETDIEYSFLVEQYVEDDVSIYRTTKNKELYMDVDGNALYFGRIIDVETIEDAKNGNNSALLTVSVSVKHKTGSGYRIGDYRIAVGSEYTLRSESVFINGTVVELAVLSDENGGN